MGSMSDAPRPVSTTRILGATTMALIVAAVVLVVAVLPAEYGIDPLGTGARLGLTGLAAVEDESGSLTMLRGVNTSQPDTYKVDTIQVRLRPGKAVEYKYHMESGRSMVYSWNASGNVMYDFHGQPDGKPAEDSRSYDKTDRPERNTAHGAFTAPFTGVHGWYFENPGETEVRITVTSAGFYDRAEQFMDKGGHFIFDVVNVTPGEPRQTLVP
jgi:hypothetical protein